MLVLALVPNPNARSYLDAQLRIKGRIVHCRNARQLVTLHRRSTPACVILGLESTPASSLSELVLTLRQSHEECPIIGLASLAEGRRELAEALVAVSRAGISRLVFNPCDGLGREIDCAIAATATSVICQRVRDSVRELVPSITLRVIDAVLSYPGRSPSIGQVATCLSLARRTLIRRLADAHQPPPRIIVQWTHTLLAAHLLDGSHRTVESVSREAGCGNPEQLRRLLRGHLSATPRQLRISGSYARGIELFAAEFSSGEASSPIANHRVPEAAT